MAEKEVLKRIEALFKHVNAGVASGKITDISLVAATVTLGLTNILADVLHPNDSSAGDGFVTKVDKIVRKYT